MPVVRADLAAAAALQTAMVFLVLLDLHLHLEKVTTVAKAEDPARHLVAVAVAALGALVAIGLVALAVLVVLVYLQVLQERQ